MVQACCLPAAVLHRHSFRTSAPMRTLPTAGLLLVYGPALAVALSLASACAESVRRAGQRTMPSPALAEFERRVTAYLALRERLERTLEPLRPELTARELAARQEALLEAVRRARSADSVPLLPEPVAEHVRGVLHAYFGRKASRQAAEEHIGVLPSGPPPTVNARYPSSVPLSTVPPALVATLPRLPHGLQYRLHGDYLIVLDTELSLVVDRIDDALPPYSSPFATPPLAQPRDALSAVPICAPRCASCGRRANRGDLSA